MASAHVTETDVAVLAAPLADARIAEADVAVLAQPPTSVNIAEVDVAVMAKPPTEGAIAEVDVAVLAYIGPCATKRCQVWKIARRDGVVLGFTSHDAPVEWLGVTFSPCKSLSASAAESASELGSAGDVELTGILDDAAIAEADLYAGLYDDAFVEVWVIPWDGQPDDGAPFRVAAGWTGKVTRREGAFGAEVLGPGARLQQAALVDVFAPGCRWTFGVKDTNGIGCPVDRDALKIAAVAVTGASLRMLVRFTASDPGAPAVFNGGVLTWLTGRNAGISCQVETVDFGSGVLSLWDPAPFMPQASDTFDLFPGCPKTKAACIDYAAYTDFGGFDDIPGPDALQSNADSLFTGLD